MAAISQKVPNLLGGISQQPDPVKLAGQVVDAVNVSLDPTFGCKKRPPIKFLGQLATNIPTDAHWFPIFRDSFERYVGCIYQNTDGTASIRVFNAETSVEQTVNTYGSAAEYLVTDSRKSLHQLTINDYTMICNGEKIVTMSGSGEEAIEEALVIVNEVGYNTTYGIDFLETTNNQKVKLYRAKKLSISPGSFEVTGDNGACSLSGNQNFVLNGSGNKTGLGFSIITNCTPTLVTTTLPGIFYPTAVSLSGGAVMGLGFGGADNYGAGSYVYVSKTANTSAGSITVRIEARVTGDNTGSNKLEFSSAVVTNYTTSGSSWRTGISFDLPNYDNSIPNQATFTVSSVQQGPSGSSYEYKSVYDSQVRLNANGANWRVGDSVNATVNGKTYTITVEEETFGYGFDAVHSASYTTAVDSSTSGPLNVNDIVQGLESDILAIVDGAGAQEYTVDTIGNVLRIKRTDNAGFNLQCRGGTTNNALYGVKSEVSDISRLPAQCIPGVTLKIRNTSEAAADDYYVVFEGSEGEIPGTGTWVETVKPGIVTDINASTMPHVLIREADGDFTFRSLSKSAQIEANGGVELPEEDYLFWAGRLVGDTVTNPNPSFVGDTIRDMFFYMNRLGLLSGSDVIMSQPSDYYNFFSGSAISASDADPIDLTASSTKPSSLKSALGTSKGLLLFAENAQFLMGTSDIAFGPATVKITEISNYAYTSHVRPLESGVSVIFSTEADTYSKVFEMAVDSLNNRPLVAENTRIIPELIPPDLMIAASSPNNSFICFGSGDQSLYTFKFYNEGNNRTIAGWARWVFPGDIKLFEFTHDTGFVVMYNETNSSHTIGRLEFLDDPDTAPISVHGRKFVPRMDNYLFDSDVTESTVDSLTTRLTLPSGFYVEGSTVYLLDAAQGNAIQYFEYSASTDGTNYYIDVPTLQVEGSYLVGLGYQMKIELPTFFVVEEQRSDRRNIPVVENVYLDLHLSGSLDVLLKRVGYDDRYLTIEQPSADIYLANDPAITDVRTQPLPVFCRGSQASVTITADSPLPVSLSSYSWEGHYNNRGIQSIV
jgi:hypothetical protein